MKINNLLGFVLVLYITTIYTSSSSTDLNDIKIQQQVALYQEMSDKFFSSYVGLPKGNYRSSASASNLAVDEIQNIAVKPASEFLIARHREEGSSSRSIQFSNGQEVANSALIPANARIVEVPVVLEDYRTPRNIKLPIRTRVGFAFLTTFSLIKLGIDIIETYTYFSQSQSLNARPTLPIAELANDAVCCTLLYALFKQNEDKL